MKILAVQGSPRPRMSNTETLLQQLLKGAENESATCETVYLKNIHWCQGCYTCWNKTPGVCVFTDDMPELLDKVKGCDIIVYATPLYNSNVTALLKAFQERLLPLLDPHLAKSGGIYQHPQRYPAKRRMVLVSTCGFPEVSHFDTLRQFFRRVERSDGTPLVGEILMPAGDLLKQEMLRPKTQFVLEAAYRAGIELVLNGSIAKETEASIQAPVIPADQMASMANIFLDSFLQNVTGGAPLRPGRVEDMKAVLRGMAASFKAGAAGDLKAIIQFNVTGGQPGDWYVSIEGGLCTLKEGQADSPNLTIITPSEVWIAIANHELDRQKTFLEGKYSVQGDLGLLMRMNSFFEN